MLSFHSLDKSRLYVGEAVFAILQCSEDTIRYGGAFCYIGPRAFDQHSLDSIRYQANVNEPALQPLKVRGKIGQAVNELDDAFRAFQDLNGKGDNGDHPTEWVHVAWSQWSWSLIPIWLRGRHNAFSNPRQ